MLQFESLDSKQYFYRFPAQETISGASKIPSIIYYDTKGKVRAVGAEATKDGVYEAALEGDWYRAEWCIRSVSRLVLPKFSSVRFSHLFCRTENRTGKSVPEPNRNRNRTG